MRLIAIGSPFLDDDISYRIMDAIKPSLLKRFPSLDICYLDRPGLQLVNEMRNADCAILVDALLAPRARARVIQLQERDLDHQDAIMSSHDLSVPQAIKLARQLAVIPDALYIFGIGIDPQRPLNTDEFAQACNRLLMELEPVCSQHVD